MMSNGSKIDEPHSADITKCGAAIVKLLSKNETFLFGILCFVFYSYVN